MNRTLLSLLLISTLFAFSPINAPAAKDIVDTAVAAGNFTTLVTAIKAAGLVETLKGKGLYLFLHQRTKLLLKSQKKI